MGEEFRLGLRVQDVPAAAAFYAGLGFEEVGSVSDPTGRSVMAILQRGESGCTITCEPMDEAWGERVFECLDPFGYQWEFSQPIDDGAPRDGLAAVRSSWFGDDVEGH